METSKGNMPVKTETNFYSQIVGDFRHVPLPLRKAVLALRKNELWMKIGKVLTNVPLDEKLTNTRLRNAIRSYLDENHVRYTEVDKILEALKDKGFITEENTEPKYYPTSIFVESLRFIDMLEEETIRPLVQSLKEDPEFEKEPNIETLVESGIYSALEESLKR